MSSLGGIYQFDGASVDPAALMSLGRLLDPAGPDGGAEFHAGTSAMAFRAFHTTKESRNEIQPLVSSGGHVLCWDGRLDNRAPLIEQLNMGQVKDQADTAVVMAAYIRWGLDFLARIVGDFSLSLWDASSRTLILARDAIGSRPLYYHASATSLIWSSELRAILALDVCSIKIDHEYVAGYLAAGAELNRTPYSGIDSVQPGFAVVIHDGNIQKKCHSTVLPHAEVRYQQDHQYEEHFRTLFREAVACRLRADHRVWAELSGGLDSSSIVCVADEILAEGHAAAPGLETISYIYPHSPTSDESEFIEAVQKHRNRQGRKLPEDDLLLNIAEPEYLSIVRPNPTWRFSSRQKWLYQQMRCEGDGVLLCGLGGDNVMWGAADPSPELMDWFASFKWVRLHGQARSWAQALNRPYLSVLWEAISPLLPGAGRRRRAAARRRLNLFQPEFARRVNMLERLALPPMLFPPRRPSDVLWSQVLFTAVAAVSRCYYRDRVPIDYAFPFMHRPLIEFVLSIPLEQFLRFEQDRSLQRRALRTVLPPLIAGRRSKRGPGEALCRALRNRWREIAPLFKNPRVCEFGYVEPKTLSRLLDEARNGLNSFGSDISNIFCLELWLRALKT